jgi:hypothetical protein
MNVVAPLLRFAAKNLSVMLFFCSRCILPGLNRPTYEILKTGGADGTALVGKGQYLVSSWQGEIYSVDASESKKILDTREEKINAADIAFDAKTKTLFIPTFLANSVMAYIPGIKFWGGIRC